MHSSLTVETDPAFTDNHMGTKTPMIAACIVGGILLLYAAVRMIRRHHRDHPHHRRHY